jgi:hypothetical protein
VTPPPAATGINVAVIIVIPVGTGGVVLGIGVGGDTFTGVDGITIVAVTILVSTGGVAVIATGVDTSVGTGTGGIGTGTGNTVGVACGVFNDGLVSAEVIEVLLIVGNVATIRRRLTSEFKAVFRGTAPSSVAIQREGIRLSTMFDAVDRPWIDINHVADCLTVTAAVKSFHNDTIDGSLDSLMDRRRAVPF